MKVCIIQPFYSYDPQRVEECHERLLAQMDACGDDLDLIVLPEYSDVPADVHGARDFHAAMERYGESVMNKARETAVRCGALVFVNMGHKTATGWRNTTHAIDRDGNVIGRYYKAHPAPSEVRTGDEGGYGIDVGYSYSFEEPYTLDIEGVRYGFMTCYDFYFYEAFAALARKNVDIIIGCSLQRTDTHQALSIINRFLSYNTNAYLIRASVSLGEESPVCGGSTVIAPDGTVLVDMKSRAGMSVCEIDPKQKYYKAAGYNGSPKAHYEYMEEGRRPWLYRNGGPSVVPFESVMPYPRLCAHRGFNTIAPENSMPAFGAAVALGAQEIEFDIWSTSDRVLVSCHDGTLERVSNGSGKIWEHSYEELKTLDFGVKHGPRFKGLSISTFEEILRKLSGRVIMNIHVKIWDCGMEDDMLPEIVALIRKYDAERHVYFMTTNDAMLKKAKEYAPDIACCVGWDGNKDKMSMVNRALALGIKKIQLFKPYFDGETVRAAHENGIICNVFWSDDPTEAREFREMGIDTILTNDYLAIANALKEDN